MKTVLFVCVHNSGRSQMAQAWFNHLSGGSVVAVSAGTQPSGKVNPLVVEAMLQVGIDISCNKPRALSSDMLQKADRVITMGCLGADACPAGFVRTEDWDLPDPQGKSLAEIIKIRDEIKRLVLDLLKDLESEYYRNSKIPA